MYQVARFICVFAVLIVCLSVPKPAFAQASDRDGRIAAFVSSAVGDGGPAPAVGLTAGHRVARNMRLEIDATYIRNLDFGSYYSCPPNAVCVALASFPFTLRGDAASLGGNVVAELPWRTRRIRPYLVGGAGVAHVRREERQRRFDLSTTRRTFSSTRPLLTAGGGVDFLFGNHMALGADARYQRMFEKDQFHRIDIPPNLDLVRIGSSIGYRF